MAISTRLFVGNLPNNTNEDDVRSAFSGYGQLVNVDVKTKTDGDQDKKVFAFVTLSASNHEVESCIKNFSNKNFNGNMLYVTRARESFLERLQRERQENQNKISKVEPEIKKKEVVHRKRKISNSNESPQKEVLKPNNVQVVKKSKSESTKKPSVEEAKITSNSTTINDKKKNESDVKRLESLKKKRQEFKQKQNIIKSGLVGIDKIQNKKIKFDNDDASKNIQYPQSAEQGNMKKSQALFDEDDESDGEVNFNVKEQFEGKKGQKVLDLQSRYKSDRRFVLDKRFIEDEAEASQETTVEEEDRIDQTTSDEKNKQLSILQDVLGIAIAPHTQELGNKKTKNRMGMLRFDPLQPEHAKLLAPIDETKQQLQKMKRNKNKDKIKEEPVAVQQQIADEKVEVSKEQFYKVSETLKEAIAQPTSFSLRSLFNKEIEDSSKDVEQDSGYIPLQAKAAKKINPFEPTDKNPFTYDSSASEAEEDETRNMDVEPLPQVTKAVWKENFFFAETDPRFTEGLAFFNNSIDNVEHKERRELKYLMKKRIYNKERKNQMFQKKIGGRKKTMKKSYRKK